MVFYIMELLADLAHILDMHMYMHMIMEIGGSGNIMFGMFTTSAAETHIINTLPTHHVVVLDSHNI